MTTDIEWLLVRDYDMHARNGREGLTLGKLYFERGADHICETVEDEDRRIEEGNAKIPGRSAIPLGRYRLNVYKSPKHGYVVAIGEVPGFTHVEMHGGNNAEQLRGCIALGMERTLDGVSRCKSALSIVLNELQRRTMQDMRVFLTIERA